MTTRLRLFIIATWFTLSFAAAGAPPQSTALQSGDSPQRAVINQYCGGCHNERVKSGDLALNSFDADRPGEHPEIWEKVVRKLRGRMMPPPGRPRPDEKAYGQVIS